MYVCVCVCTLLLLYLFYFYIYSSCKKSKFLQRINKVSISLSKKPCTLLSDSLAPQGADGVGLSQLDDDGPGAQLVAGVARVPVVVAGVTVEQGVSAAAHALDDAGTRRHSGHVLAGNCRGST